MHYRKLNFYMLLQARFQNSGAELLKLYYQLLSCMKYMIYATDAESPLSPSIPLHCWYIKYFIYIQLWLIRMSGHNNWSPSRACECFHRLFRSRILSNGAAYRHEESKGCARSEHILTKSPHYSIRAGTVSHDVHGAKYKTNNHTDSASHHRTHLDWRSLDQAHPRQFRQGIHTLIPCGWTGHAASYWNRHLDWRYNGQWVF